jgi:hypothetical protein
MNEIFFFDVNEESINPKGTLIEKNIKGTNIGGATILHDVLDEKIDYSFYQYVKIQI